ncbi:MAG: glycoside hydrolase family 95 protein [candidate division FCPU426 bacterium]
MAWTAGTTAAPADLSLWYDKPAQYFEECLPLGNGRIGASVFGGVESDKIFLNDATLWSGGPVQADMNPDAHTFLPALRAALKKEDYPLADSISKKMQGTFSQSYAPLGTLLINFKHNGPSKNYRRSLDLSRAVSDLSYEVDGVRFSREYFVSYPDKIIAIKLTSSKKGALNFALKFDSLLKYQVELSDNLLKARGCAPIHAEPDYRGGRADAVSFDSSKGTRFSARVKIQASDGTIKSSNGVLSLEGGSEAVVLVAIATSFNGFDKDPATQGLDDQVLATASMQSAYAKSYEDLKKAHLIDFKGYFDRLALDLRGTGSELPTDLRLKRYAEGADDKGLEVLYFQFGRYLLISSSRTPGVPANLQGIWNPYLQPPWSSNYTTNINVEENYWLAENANLSEMHAPLLGLIKNIASTGAVTAKNFYGIQGGWTACHNSDIWAMSNPVGNFGEGDPVWANWNMGGAWLSTHLWEHYQFSQDKKFLKDQAYPLMRGAALFCEDWLVEDAQGKLITSPSSSPENKYVDSKGYHGAILFGGTADLAMIRECFEQTIAASKVLDTDLEFRTRLEKALASLHPYQIGKKGNLQEWYYDWEDEDPRHRHQSHLFGLYPGHQITVSGSPDLAAACRKTLEIKGDETTGWSKGWRINLWARLRDGNHAYKMLRELMRYVPPDGAKINYGGGGGTYPNLWDAHPPFQIDGNFGGSAAFLEMLVQSVEGEITLLPALPDAWDTGSISGVCARGGYEIAMQWEHKTLKKVAISAKRGSGKVILLANGEKKELTLKQGEETLLDW